MASVNKQSLREEFDALKGSLSGCAPRARWTAESRALFQALLMLFELLMAVFMEKHTPKNSRNSSLPSSQTAKDDDRRHPARQPRQGQGAAQPRPATPARSRPFRSPVHACDTCGEDLRRTPCQGTNDAPSIDIIFEKVVSHVDAEIKHCPHCQARTQGGVPCGHSPVRCSTAPASRPTC